MGREAMNRTDRLIADRGHGLSAAQGIVLAAVAGRQVRIDAWPIWHRARLDGRTVTATVRSLHRLGLIEAGPFGDRLRLRLTRPAGHTLAARMGLPTGDATTGTEADDG
jgi:hypothetical protein